MKVVFLLRYIDSGGITRVVYDSATYLLNNGAKVYIFYGKFLGEDNSFKILLESNPNLKLFQFKGFSLEISSLLHVPCSIVKFLYKLYKFRIEIVHLHWMSLSFICIISKSILKIPYITTTHLINKKKSSFFRFYSDINISISSEISNWLIVNEKVNHKFIYKIFNSVSYLDFPFIPFSVRQENKINMGFSEKTILLSLSRFENIKRHDILIDALHKIKNYDFILYLAGEGKLLSEIKQKVIDYELSDKVIFVGHIDPRFLLTYSDAIILTSDQEGFPMSIIEAMFSGVVPIRTNSEGAYDQIIDKKNGFIIEKSNVNELISVLKYIFKNPLLLEDFSNNAHLFALNNFDFVKNQNKIIELYNLKLKNQ